MRRGGYIKRKIPIRDETIPKVDLWAFYKEIWDERPHVSQISGKPLGRIMKSWMFDHLLEQKKHPELQTVKENIILCTFEEHELKSMGHPLPKHRQLIEEAKKTLINGSNTIGIMG